MLLKLVWSKIWYKRMSSFLCILLMAAGITIISLVLNLGNQFETKLIKSVSGIDMVIGAKGSPLQLILSSIFHIDSPTGNISLSESERLEKNPLIENLIPLSFGDNYQGFRIIGTNTDFLNHYETSLSQGDIFQNEMDVVIGSDLSKLLQLEIGDEFESSHGLQKEGASHSDKKYKVVGILRKNHSVIDKLIICSLSSIWSIHQETNDDNQKQITSALIKFKSPMGFMTIPRMINENTNMQAALPSIEVNRLLSLFQNVFIFAKYLAFLIVFLAGTSVFITLYNSLKDQKNEKALMLSLGATRTKVFVQLLLEGVILSFLGYLFGIILSKVILFSSQIFMSSSLLIDIDLGQLGLNEIYLLALALGIGIISAALPSIGIYKINIAETLAKD